MSKIIKESVLFRTSAASDIQCSGGNITVAGLKSVSKKDITGIYQTLYKAEVAKVSTVTTSAVIPAASTVYQIAVFDPTRFIGSYTESPKVYKYKTSNDLSVEGATAALQREYINVQLIAAINADDTCHATAATLTGGAGFTVTDAGGYYPVFSQGMTNIKGINAVYTQKNADGTGFVGTEAAITTAAVYSYGTGANLLASNPIVSFVFGNLISGVLDAPPVTSAGLTAVTGQNYDGFTIVSLKAVSIIGLTGQYGYQDRQQVIFVDNGTGSATTNLTGFRAFERVMHKLMLQNYASDASAVQEFFDKPIAFQGPLGAAPAGTADVLGWMISPYGSLNITNIGTQTIVAPVLNATGLLIDQDDTATEGSHVSANQQTLGDQCFIVGKTDFSLNARIVMADWTDAAFMIGFRKKAVYGAVINNYTDYATIGNGSSVAGTTWINGDFFVTRANLNGGTTLQTISAVAPTDTVSAFLQVRVAVNGAVSCFVNGTSYPVYSVGTTPMVFDAGDEMIPFYQIVNIGGGDPAASISEFFAVPTTALIA